MNDLFEAIFMRHAVSKRRPAARRPLLQILSMTALLFPCAATWAAIEASVDRNQVAAGDTIQLTLETDSSPDGSPDTVVLRRDFDVLGTSSGSSVQIVNGHFSRHQQFQIQLSPRHGGTLVIPPVRWGNDSSKPLTVVVGAGSGGNGASGSGSADNNHVTMTAEVDDHQPYVQGAVVLTVHLRADATLRQAGLQMPDSSDASISQIGEDHQTTEQQGGRVFQQFERRYLVQPQHSGTITLEGPVLEGQVLDTGGRGRDPYGDPFGMLSSVRPIRLHGDPITLEVRPRPAGFNDPNWLPAQHLTLEEGWKPSNGKLKVGEPLTVHLRLTATGIVAAQLPDLSAQLGLPDGLKAYPDQPKLNNELDDGKVVGTREQDVAIIASRPGHYQIPELHLAWWNTTDEARREIVIPARDLDILPADGAALPPVTGNAAPSVSSSAAAPANPPTPPSTSPTDAAGSTPLAATAAPGRWARVGAWPWVSLVLALGWLVTVVAWIFTAQRTRRIRPQRIAPQLDEVRATPKSASVSASLSTVRIACERHDAAAARAALLRWAAAVWPEQAPTGLNGLAQRFPQASLAEAVRELERACYTGGVWQGATLAAQLNLLPTPASAGRRSQQGKGGDGGITELYR